MNALRFYPHLEPRGHEALHHGDCCYAVQRQVACCVSRPPTREGHEDYHLVLHPSVQAPVRFVIVFEQNLPCHYSNTNELRRCMGDECGIMAAIRIEKREALVGG